MAARRHERTRARRTAIQVLYTSAITQRSATDIAEGDDILVEGDELPAYALSLVRGIEAHQCTIDERLSATSENWSLARMPIIDRSILRLAVFEMMFVEDVPVSVAINEAVELAKEFGGEDESPRFVNGVLGRIAEQLQAGEAAPGAADAVTATARASKAVPGDAAAPADLPTSAVAEAR